MGWRTSLRKRARWPASGPERAKAYGLIPGLLIILETALLAYPLFFSQAKLFQILALCSLLLFFGALVLARSLLLFILNGFLLAIMFGGTLPWDRYSIDLYGAALYGLLLYLFWELSTFYIYYHRYQIYPLFALRYGIYLIGTTGGFWLLTLLFGVTMISGFGQIPGLFRPLLIAIGSALAFFGLLLWLILWYKNTVEEKKSVR